MPLAEPRDDVTLTRWVRVLGLVGTRGLPFALAAVLAWAFVEEARSGLAGTVIVILALVDGLALFSWFVLGTILDARTRRRMTAAEALLPEKISAGAPPGEVLELGVRLAEHGRTGPAEEAFSYVEAAGDDKATPEAALALGVLRALRDDTDGAAEAWRTASRSKHPEHAPNADYNLGRLHQNLGEPAEAKAAYRRAMKSGHGQHAPMAAVNLGALYLEERNHSGARTAFQYAVDHGDADQAGRGRAGLAQLR